MLCGQPSERSVPLGDYTVEYNSSKELLAAGLLHTGRAVAQTPSLQSNAHKRYLNGATDTDPGDMSDFIVEALVPTVIGLSGTIWMPQAPPPPPPPRTHNRPCCR